MRYIQYTLLRNETLIYYTRPHWIIFSPSAIVFIIAILFLWYGPALKLGGFRLVDLQLYQIGALFAALIGVYAFLKALINYKTSEYGITDKRVLMKTGWIQRNALEIFLDKIEAVNVDQTIIGRILNYGTIIIVGTGGTQDPFFNVPDPLRFRKQVQQQIAYDEQQRSREEGK